MSFEHRAHRRRVAGVLWILLALFCLRVLGQTLVAFAGVTFLPPMDEWYSGLIPYPILLPLQLAVIALLTRVCLDFSRGEGTFFIPRRVFGRPALIFGYVYLGAMVARYVIRMTLLPEERWFGGTIPIFFHWVLAAFVITFARYHRARVHAAAG